MSLVLSVVYGDSVQMLTDGAAIDPAGNLLSVTRKVSASSSPLLAISGRGDSHLITMIREASMVACEGRSFDETLDIIETMLREIADTVASKGIGFEVIIAGFSETRGASHYAMASHGDIEWLPPYHMTHVEHPAINFGCEWNEQILAEEGVTGEMLAAAGDVALSLFGPQIGEMMRRTSGMPMPSILHNRPDQCIVGGHLDLTTVTRSSAVIERIHEWPDEIGLPIKADGARRPPLAA